MEEDKIYEKLKSSLETIGWTLEDYGCEHYRPVDYKGRVSNYVYWKGELKSDRSCDDALELSCTILTLDNIKVKNGSFVSVGSDENFILFMNHDKKHNK